MLTLERAKKLEPREVLVAGNGSRWKVNGKVQLWKRNPNRIRVPLKHGLYRYGQLTDSAFMDTFMGEPVSTYWSVEGE